MLKTNSLNNSLIQKILQTCLIISGLVLATMVASQLKAQEVDALACPVDKGTVITSGYGPRGGSFHAGIDLGVRYRPLFAAENGNASSRWSDSYGNQLDLTGDSGRVYRYAHLDKGGTNGRVNAGQTIGTSGNTGNSSGPHLHWEIRDNAGYGSAGTIDPAGEYNNCTTDGGGAPPVAGNPGGEAPCSHPTIERNNTGSRDCVIHLQQHLNTKGYGLAVDGAWGNNTDNAVRDFQRKQGWSGAGIVGPSTWDALHSAPPSTAPSAAPPASSSGFYKIRAVDFNGRCVDADNNANEDGGRVQQHDCISFADNQLVRLNDKGGGYYDMQFRYNNKCVDIFSFNQSNGAETIQWTCNGKNNQLFKLVPRGGDKFSLQFRHSNKCLDFDSNQNHNGGKAQQWDCHDNSNQRFQILPRVPETGTGGPTTPTSPPSNQPPQNQPPTTGSALPAGNHNLVVKGKCMDVRGPSTADGAQMQQWGCVANANNQQFRFESRGGGYYRIIARHSNKCVDFHNGQLRNGGLIHQYSCHTGDNQLFSFQSIGSGRYLIKAKAGGRCIDSPYGNNGRILHQWDCISSNVNQQFSLRNPSDSNSVPQPTNPPPTTNKPPTNTQPPPPPASGTRYKVRSVFNNRCVDADVAAGENRDGGRVQQWDCISSQTNQLIRLNDKGGGWYEMKFQHDPQRCVDVYGFGKGNGASVVQWPCNGSTNQLVKKVYQGSGSQGGYYQLEFKHAPGMCLDFDSNQNRNNGKVQLWQCLSNNTNQRFYLLER